jgi:uncharacterized membrane protein
MLRSLLRYLRQMSRRIHVRVVLFAVLAFLAPIAAVLAGPVIPDGLAGRIGAGAVDDILSTLATSMLAVTTFSLTIMVSAMNNAAAQWTPRSHLILRQDTVTHSVLANFLGAFLFALIAIILRSAEAFDARGMVILFGLTLIVVMIVVLSLIRWIVHLEGLGSLAHTAGTLQDEAAQALQRARDMPCHGGHALVDPDRQIPEGAVPFHADRAGYLEQVFEEALQSAAEAADADIYLVVAVGQYVVKGEELGRVACPRQEISENLRLVLREALPLSEARSFEQDPLFGLTVLAEVGTRALSPGVNDPGTAIDVINRLGQLIAQAGVGVPQDAPSCGRLWARPLPPEVLFEVSYEPLAHCAGDAIAVHLALRSSLAQVIAHGADEAVRDAARAVAQDCLARTQIGFAPDLARLGAAAA